MASEYWLFMCRYCLRAGVDIGRYSLFDNQNTPIVVSLKHMYLYTLFCAHCQKAVLFVGDVLPRALHAFLCRTILCCMWSQKFFAVKVNQMVWCFSDPDFSFPRYIFCPATKFRPIQKGRDVNNVSGTVFCKPL